MGLTPYNANHRRIATAENEDAGWKRCDGEGIGDTFIRDIRGRLTPTARKKEEFLAFSMTNWVNAPPFIERDTLVC